MPTVNAQQIPPSPSVQQSPVNHATPSTVGASGSPLRTPGPLIANVSGSAEASGRRQETTRMRSSIACSRCRRSKTKCDNNGIRDSTGALAPCKSCVASKKVCDYPAPQPAASNHAPRRESTATTAGEEVCGVLFVMFLALDSCAWTIASCVSDHHIALQKDQNRSRVIVCLYSRCTCQRCCVVMTWLTKVFRHRQRNANDLLYLQ